MPTGGEPILPADVVVAALAQLPRRYYLAGRVRYLQDWTVTEELSVLLWERSADFAQEHRWQLPRGKNYLWRLSRLAVAELAEPREFFRLSVRQEATGIPKSTWYRTWQGRYQVVFGELSKWADIAALHLHHRLRSV